MKRNLTVSILVLAVSLLIAGVTGCTKLRARDSLNKGVQAYKNAQYSEAVEYFKRSVELDSEFPTARLYLATAYMSQYIPGAESPENEQMAQAALDEFARVLDQDPQSIVALASIGSLLFLQKRFAEAEEWYKKLIGVDPDYKEAYYTLGVIAWTRTFQRRMEARAELGMTPEDPGPLKDKKVRERVREVNLPIIEDGLAQLTRAVEVDPEYDDAMAYLNLLYRERADLANTKAEYLEDVKRADDWVDKTLGTKKIKAMRAAPAAIFTEE